MLYTQTGASVQEIARLISQTSETDNQKLSQRHKMVPSAGNAPTFGGSEPPALLLC